MAVYEIEWKVGWTEYAYEINASTGEVVSYEMDYDDSSFSSFILKKQKI